MGIETPQQYLPIVTKDGGRSGLSLYIWVYTHRYIYRGQDTAGEAGTSS